LELIETSEYFGIDPEKIEVLVHPQSIVHALVGFQDGGLMAHVGPPDMRHAIGYALHYPTRAKLPVERLDLARIGQLEFSNPDPKRYPALGLAYEVMGRGGLSGAVFNAAKDMALDRFMAGQIGFTQMADVVKTTLDQLLPDDGLIDAPMTLDNLRRAAHLGQSTAQSVTPR
jgi:1-deoxy-D-xylulose-5-phosphate reductoisomerase